MHRTALVAIATLCTTVSAQTTYRVSQLDITGFVHTFSDSNAASAFEPGGLPGCEDAFGVLQVAEPNPGATLAVIDGPFQPVAGDTLEFAVAAPAGTVVRVNRPSTLQVEIQQVLFDCCQSSPEPVRAYVRRNGLLVQEPIDLPLAASSFLAFNEFVDLQIEPCSFDEIVFRLEDISGFAAPITAESPGGPPPFAGTFDAVGDFSAGSCDDIPVRTAEIVPLVTPAPGVVRLRQIEIAGFSHTFDSGAAISELDDFGPIDCQPSAGFLQKTDLTLGFCDGTPEGAFSIAQGDRAEIAITAPIGQVIRLNRPATFDVNVETLLTECCLSSPDNVFALALREGIVVHGPIDTGAPGFSLFNGFAQLFVDLPACSFDTLILRVDNLDAQPMPFEVLPDAGSPLAVSFGAPGDFSSADCDTPTTAQLVDRETPDPIETADADGNGFVDIQDLLAFLALWFSGL